MGLDFGYVDTQLLRQRKRVSDASKRNSVERRLLLNQMKSVPCTDCGEEYPFYVMDFDHRDPLTKKFNIQSGARRHPWDRVLEEVAKCDVVCVRCHRIRHWSPPVAPLTKRQKMVRELKNVPCVDCKCSFHHSQMDFDHTGEKKGQVPLMNSLEALVQEASHCEVVCANCHRERSQRRGKGSSRLRHQDVDMTWRHRSKRNPQTVLANEGNPASRSWHPLAGMMPDGQAAHLGGVTRSAILKYRSRMGIPPFQPRGGCRKLRSVEVSYA